MTGTLHRIKPSVNVKYKLCIRDAYNAYESAHDNSIHVHWRSEINPQEFWKAWRGKYVKKVNASVHLLGCMFIFV